MKNSQPNLVAVIVKYDVLLQRYARRLVKDQAVAAALVKEMFEQVYDLNGFEMDSKTLRKLFKGHTYKLASLWISRQPVNNSPNN